jgi:hypothetical protein
MFPLHNFRAYRKVRVVPPLIFNVGARYGLVVNLFSRALFSCEIPPVFIE